MIKTVITGASGRMGQALISLLTESRELQLHAAVDAAGNTAIGSDAGQLAGLKPNGIIVGDSLGAALRGAQLLIDFSSAGVTATQVRAARDSRVPMLIGTTGLDAEVQTEINLAARTIAVLPSSNTSVGVALLAALVQQAARALGPEFNIEVTEAHHKHKLDAPSGTALTLAEAAARGRGVELAAVRSPLVRGSAGPRLDTEIGISSIRGGDVVGDHEVAFLGTGERLMLRHSATDRAIFARGALRAGAWLATQRPGRYQMADVFGLKDQ
jgi:4-hydroxy-tetrahydrodipicolinate reductase